MGERWAPSRREFLAAATATVVAGLGRAAAKEEQGVLDAHVHVWNLKQFQLPWLSADDKVLHRNFLVSDYLDATKGLNVRRAVYVEIGLDAAQQADEVRHAIDLCREKQSPFAAAVIGGDPADPGFQQYLDRYRERSVVRGVRHGYERGGNRDNALTKGLRLLGERRMTFDLLLGPELLNEAAELAAACPDTQFILDHCGNIDPLLFRKGADATTRERRDLWRRGIEALAKRLNVACKISGVMESGSGKARPDDASPVVHHCLDAFGPDRVMVASNWPVCLKGTTIREWLAIVRQITASRTDTKAGALFFINASRIYGIVEKP